MSTIEDVRTLSALMLDARTLQRDLTVAGYTDTAHEVGKVVITLLNLARTMHAALGLQPAPDPNDEAPLALYRPDPHIVSHRGPCGDEYTEIP